MEKTHENDVVGVLIDDIVETPVGNPVVIKRNGETTVFDSTKIVKAIEKAMDSFTGVHIAGQAEKIANEVKETITKLSDPLTVRDIEDYVYFRLIELGNPATAKAYEGYRSVQEYKRITSPIDKDVVGIIDSSNEAVVNENSNKDAKLLSTQRDLIAGEVSKDLARRTLLPPDILLAHDSGAIHFHDMDYIASPMFNCFSGDTEFITAEGVKKFTDFKNGDKTDVITKGGSWRKATVKLFGKDKLATVTFNVEGCPERTKTVRATANHRWVLDNESVVTTVELKTGDVMFMDENLDDGLPWVVFSVDYSDQELHEVWCVVEPETESFYLADNLITKNCCLVDLKDMLTNGTVINGKKIDSPHSFQVACTITTQIIAQVASGQFGGQSINGFDRILAPFLRKSYDRYLAEVKAEQQEYYDKVDEDTAVKIAEKRLHKELEAGIQTIQYQINTLMTTNGQAPFVTLFLHFDPEDKDAKFAAMIQEEVLRQRLQGIKNEQDVYVTPAFPKLIYCLDEHNAKPDSPYYYITKLAAKCTAKRMYPDYISAKKMKEIYEGNVFSPMGCRSFLSPWQNEDGVTKLDGRFNMGVVSLNLPQIAILAQGDEEKFFNILEKRFNLVKQALLLRYELLKRASSDVSPIHYQHGAIARLKSGEPINQLLENGYATISFGYIGVYEMTKLMTGESHTTEKGKAFAEKVISMMKQATVDWKEETGLGFGLYGTPAESLTNRFCAIDRKRFGVIPDVTDKGYYTNSYHVDVRENISVFDKFQFESTFQEYSTGGAISYAEIPNMVNNTEAIETMIQFIYDNISYAEFNTKSDFCHDCSYDGEILAKEDGVTWYCPNCGNEDKNRLTVIRRTCGYLGENFWNEGRTKEINSRVLHI